MIKKNFIYIFLFFNIIVSVIIFLEIHTQTNETGKVQKQKKLKGVAITLNNVNNNAEWYDQMFPKIKALDAELEIVTGVEVLNLNDSNPINDPNIDEKFKLLFQKSEEYQVEIGLIKPHIMLSNLNDNIDRKNYNPSDIETFFSKWEDIILYYAAINAKYNIPTLSITCETAILTQYNYVERWGEIIDKIKSRYPNLQLTVSYSKYELDRELKYYEEGITSLSSLLDIISVNLYPGIKRNSTSQSVQVNDDIFIYDKNSYGIVEGIQKAKMYFNKDILITETGATAKSNPSNSYISPLNLNQLNPSNHFDQNEWMSIVLRVFLEMEEVEGVYIWHVDYPFQFLDSITAETIKRLFEEY